MTPIRVLHLDEQRGWRGGEQQASYLIRGLAERGHEVFVAGRAGGVFVARDHGVEPSHVITCRFAGEFDLITAGRLARFVRRNQIQILHAHTSHTHTVACAARRLGGGTARVVVSRRVDFPPSRSIWSTMKYRWPDQFVAISQTIADVLLRAGVPKDRVSVVHSAIDLERFGGEPLRKDALGVPADAYLIGNVAALVGHKDQATLVRAMRRVVDDLPSARLVIAGEGPLRAELTRLRDELGLSGYVHFLGFRDDVPRLLRTLDLFVMSSKEEGLGTSVLDAMASEVPVVATAGGGIPEMVRNGETGWLTAVGNDEALAAAILEAARNPARCSNQVRAARAMVRNRFNVDHMVEGNLRVYQRVLERGAG